LGFLEATRQAAHRCQLFQVTRLAAAILVDKSWPFIFAFFQTVIVRLVHISRLLLRFFNAPILQSVKP
jgi:hypothetical protein